MFMGEQPGRNPSGVVEKENFMAHFAESLMRMREEGARHYDKDYSDPALQNAELCAKCGGQCCKRCGCAFSPDDFEDLSYEALKAEIEKGYITIEVVDGDQFYISGFVLMLRARNVGGLVYENRLYYRPRGQCVLLTEHGCKLDWEHRPSGGRLLVPTEGGSCPSRYSTEHALREWKKHQSVLSRLANYFDGKEIECTL